MSLQQFVEGVLSAFPLKPGHPRWRRAADMWAEDLGIDVRHDESDQEMHARMISTMSDKVTETQRAAFPVGSRVTIGSDARTIGIVEAYELGDGFGRPFVRCDDGSGYWCERFQLRSAVENG